MKPQTQIDRTWKRQLSAAAAFVMVTVMALALSACGKKKSTRPVAPPVAPVVNLICPTCTPSSQFLMSAIGGVYGVDGVTPKMELGLQFYTDGASPMVLNNPYMEYSGRFFAHGTFRVFVNDTPTLCNIPVGHYEVRSYQGRPGYIQASSMQDVVLEAAGPTLLYIHLPNNFVVDRNRAQVGSDGRTYPFRLQNYMVISPNGTRCFNGSFMLE